MSPAHSPGSDAWNCAKLFDFDIRDKNRYEFSKALSDTTSTGTRRARSYIAANCEMCHQPEAYPRRAASTCS